jgi:hypothetical protein
MAVKLSALRASRLPFTPRKILSTRLLKADSTPEPNCDWKSIKKIQWPHRESIPRFSGLWRSASTNYATACPPLWWTVCNKCKPTLFITVWEIWCSYWDHCSVDGLRAGRPAFDSRQGQDSSLFHSVQTGCEAYTVSCQTGTGGSFPGCNAAGAWNWPLTSVYCRGQEFWSYTSIRPMSSWRETLLIKHRDNCTFYRDQYILCSVLLIFIPLMPPLAISLHSFSLGPNFINNSHISY